MVKQNNECEMVKKKSTIVLESKKIYTSRTKNRRKIILKRRKEKFKEKELFNYLSLPTF